MGALRLTIVSIERSIEQHKKATEFLDGWIKVYQTTQGLGTSQGKELATAYAEAVLSEAMAQLQSAASRRTISKVGGGFRARVFSILDFLRFRAPRSKLAWLPQLLYYGVIAVGIRVLCVRGPGYLTAFTLSVVFVVTLWLICWALEWYAGRRAQPSQGLA